MAPRKGSEKPAVKVGKNKIIIVLLAVVAIVVVAALVQMYKPPAYNNTNNTQNNQPPKTIAQIVDEGAETCVSDNPSLTQEQCRDLSYHDTAIAEGKPELCDQIKSDEIKVHCKDYFK